MLRTRAVMLRLTEAEYAGLEAARDREGLSWERMGQWARRKIVALCSSRGATQRKGRGATQRKGRVVDGGRRRRAKR